ncbi:hypothetical protein HUF15_24290 [Streptomyces samsunensis]|uniref:hypothetical protein n=1 Tax=Streptomyces malaysiensis TaxID=92644 RepID=UPI0015825BD8|nr:MULTISPECIES: hypothetical protein [Streptomyces]MCC4316406.1 hypothetical protein [Streptomyces malaysiensis]NUH39835.1 hypothetical protein [Streptomyces samsunensis]WHX22905.1 hypothetical protein QFW82_40705 [Streptomyces sp. NA07423]
MSTPPIAGDDQTPRRLRLRRRRADADRGRRGGRASARRFPDGALPQPEPVASDVIRAGDSTWLRDRARKHGASAATRKVFDPWVLAGPDRVPYFAELASLRNRVKHRLAEEHARAEEDGALEASRVRAAATAAGERLERAGQRRVVLERQQTVTTAQLDRLARRADRWQTFRDTVRGGFERRWLRARMPADGSDGTDPGRQGATRREDEPETTGHASWQAVSEPDPVAEADAADRALSTRAAWEGAAARPGMPRWMKLGVLAALVVVELPVYYSVFENLHGVGRFADLLSYSLMVAVAVAMILAPHIAGWILRRRSATGAVRLSAVPALALLGVWAYGAWALGDLRAKVAFREEPPLDLPPDVAADVGDSVRNPPSLLESLHLDAQSVTWMFVALLLLSGGIAFLIGLGEEHPYLAAYRTTAERLRELERDMETDLAGSERAKEAEATLGARAETRRAAHEARLYAVDDLYEAAAHAYLDGVAMESSDPAVTEAAMRLSKQWPLLPR